MTSTGNLHGQFGPRPTTTLHLRSIFSHVTVLIHVNGLPFGHSAIYFKE